MASRIGLLPGTFDPVHAGHMEMARAAMAARGLDGVMLVPNARPLHKVDVSAYRHRVAMSGLAVQDEPRIRVYEGTSAQAPHVPATFVDIVRELGGERAEFVIGIDNFVTLDRWPGVESVVRNATYAVARRRGAGEPEVEALRRRLGALSDELRVTLFDLTSHRAASSSVVRERLRAGERPTSLDARVYDYIVAHSLYL